MNFIKKDIKLEKFQGLIAESGMIILFPGFFIYHLLIAATDLPPVLGGLFGGSSLLLVGLYLMGLIYNPKLHIRRLRWYGMLFLGFISFASIWALTHWILLDESYIYVALIQTAEIVILWLALFLTALWLPRNAVILEKAFLYFFIIVLVELCLFLWVTGNLEFNVRRIFLVDDGVASYAGFSRSMVIVLLFLAACTLDYLKFCLLSLAGLFTLFMLSARVEFLCFPLALMALLFMSSQSKKRILLFCFIGFVVIALLMALVVNFSELTDQNRFSELLNLEKSSSWIKRKELHDIAVSQIINQPFMGFFGGHIVADSRGGYSHNMLSAWVSFGLIGFVLYLSLSLIGLVGSIIGLSRESKIFRNEKGSLIIVWRQSLVVNVFSVILVIAAKAVFWPISALAWGLYARALYFNHVRTRTDNSLQHTE